jgi:hypothetical protein
VNTEAVPKPRSRAQQHQQNRQAYQEDGEKTPEGITHEKPLENGSHLGAQGGDAEQGSGMILCEP